MDWDDLLRDAERTRQQQEQAARDAYDRQQNLANDSYNGSIGTADKNYTGSVNTANTINQNSLNTAKNNLTLSQQLYNQIYNDSAKTLQDNYQKQSDALKARYDFSADQLKRNHEMDQQSAYVGHKMDMRNLGQQLGALGYSGGASETSLLGLINQYRSNRAKNDMTFGDAYKELELNRNSDQTNFDVALAQALQQLLNDKNTGLTGAQKEYNSAATQAANILADALNAAQTNKNNAYDAANVNKNNSMSSAEAALTSLLNAALGTYSSTAASINAQKLAAQAAAARAASSGGSSKSSGSDYYHVKDGDTVYGGIESRSPEQHDFSTVSANQAKDTAAKYVGTSAGVSGAIAELASRGASDQVIDYARRQYDELSKYAWE